MDNKTLTGMIVWIVGHPDGNHVLSPRAGKMGSIFIGEHSMPLSPKNRAGTPNTPALARSLANDHLPEDFNRIVSDRSENAIERTVEIDGCSLRLCSVTVSWHNASSILQDGHPDLTIKKIRQVAEEEPITQFLRQTKS